MSRLHVAGWLLLGAMAAGLAACGGGDGTKTVTVITPQSGVTGETIQVNARDFAFDPDEFQVTNTASVTIAITNNGSSTHNLTLYRDAQFTQAIPGGDAGNIGAGATAALGPVTIDTAASQVYFRCNIHPTQMQGVINVQ